MALTDRQVSIGGVLLDDGSDEPVTSVRQGFNPWTRSNRMKTSDRAWGHGSAVGSQWAESRTVPVPILIDAGDEAGWIAAQQRISAALAPVEDTGQRVELRWALGGSEYVLFGYPQMVEPDAKLIASGRSMVKTSFVAADDPRIYSGDLHTTGKFALPSSVGGLTVPLTVPFTIDATQVTGRRGINNTGTTKTGLLLRFDGPVIGPGARLTPPNGLPTLMSFDLSLDAGQWLEVDTLARTVRLNGQVSRRRYMSGDFPLAPPGASTLDFLADEYNDDARLTADWRSAWL